MSDTAKIVLTFKQGTGFDAPWVVIHADTVDEASSLLQEVRTKGVFPGVRSAAAEFQAITPTEGEAVTTITNAFPGSTVTSAPAPATAPASVDPRCPDCGGSMTYKSGSGKNGPYQGWFCNTKPRGANGHVIWL